MHIVTLYDIHGNLPALEAVLAEIETLPVDAIVLGGDCVSGPLPHQTLERILQIEHPVYAIHGNADREVVAMYQGKTDSSMPDYVREITQWVAEQLNTEQIEFLAQLPLIHILDDVLFCHATPRNDIDIFTSQTPNSIVAPMFADVEQAMVVCGHTHIQFEREINGVQIVNAGSVGMPFEGVPGAYWLLVRDGEIEFRHTEYDLNRANEQINTSGYPFAEQFIAENVLSVPQPAEALAVLEQMRLKQLKYLRTQE